MSNEESKSGDLLGVKPIADSINTVTQGSVDGASAFLSRICLPAAEEFGLLLRDKVSAWRANNAIKIAQKSEKLLENRSPKDNLHAHPRIIYSALEQGSWAEDDFVQGMWAGLLATACTKNGDDQSNLIFLNILSQLTSSQSALISHACESVEKCKTKAGWISTVNPIYLSLDQLTNIMDVKDFHQIDRELDHLRALDLIEGGFPTNDVKAQVNPTALCLQFYARCQGFVGSPLEFYPLIDDSTNK